MKQLFDLLFINFSLRDFKEIVLNNDVSVLAIPKNHSLEEARPFQIGFSNGVFLEFYSDLVTLKGQWHEFACLIVRFINRIDDRYRNVNEEFEEVELKNIRFDYVDKIVYEDDEVISDCGVVLGAKNFGELYICTGANWFTLSMQLPEKFEDFSVSTQLPEGFKNSQFLPDFEIESCKRVRL